MNTGIKTAPCVQWNTLLYLNFVGLYFFWRSWTSCLDTWHHGFYQIPTDKKINEWLTLLWHFSTAWYVTVWFTFRGFYTGYSTWYLVLFLVSPRLRFQAIRTITKNVTCKLYWSLIGQIKSYNKRPNIDPLDLNQHSQQRIGRNFCLNKRTFLYQPKKSCFVVCWGSIDVPLVDRKIINAMIIQTKT